MGRINLIMMNLLPKILYVLQHSPVYLILRHFRLIEAILKSFVWGNNRHKLPWHKRKNPTDLAGMALPEFNQYYLAVQLSQLFHIDKVDKDRFLCLLCPGWARPTRDPFTVILSKTGGMSKTSDRRSLLYHYRKIWDMGSARLNMPATHEFIPLWHNTALFYSIPDCDMWGSRGIFYLSHIVSDGTLKSFDRLKSEFALPNQMYFRYLQLHHAYRAQFPANSTPLANNSLFEAIKCLDPEKLISQFYSMLSLPQATVTAYVLKNRWEGELGPLEDEEWSEALDACKLVSDRLTQIFILHRSYLTPLKIVIHA